MSFAEDAKSWIRKRSRRRFVRRNSNRRSRLFEHLEPRLPLATLTVSGTAEWTDGGGNTHPIPLATVEIRDDDAVGSELITTVMTDASGSFSSTFTHDDGLLQGDPDIFVRVLARSPVADVKPSSVGAATYQLQSTVFDEVADGTNLVIPTLTAGNVTDNDTAFSIHHALVVAGQYAGNLTGSTPATVLNVLYDNSVTGSSASGSTLRIRNSAVYEWDVIWHEYGHFLASVHSIDNSSGGSHSSSQNLSPINGEAKGLPLAWSEGWATFFAISGQLASGAAGLNILRAAGTASEIGDRSYQSYAGAINNDLETNHGFGEDNELSVSTVLWDVLDTSTVGESRLDQINLNDTTIFTALKAAGADTAGAAWNALATTLDTAGKARLGGAFSLNEISPQLTGPANNMPIGDSAPTFTWDKNGGGPADELNDFRIRFYKNDFSSIIFEKELGDADTYTPTSAEWEMVRTGDVVIKWVIEGRNTDGVATPGGSLGYYWSGARALGGISIVLVIDDTGSMGQEIEGVKAALQRFIDDVEARLGPDDTPPTIQLITFKDNVTVRDTSNDLSVIRSAVAGLFASGGGDCPEFSAHALAQAAESVAAGGTILLATDAAPQPGVDIGTIIARLRANGVTVNTILSGDCTGISSASATSLAACEEFGQGELDSELDLLAPETPEIDNTPAEVSVVVVGVSSEDTPDGVPDDDEPPRMTIVDPGQPPLDDHGSSPATATRLLVNSPPVRGAVGLTGDSEDYFHVAMTAGTEYTVELQRDSGSGFSVTLLDTDGTTFLRSAFVGTFPARISFTSPADGEYFARISRFESALSSSYQISVSDDPLKSLTSAVDVFSTVSDRTGGAFVVLDNVNFGSPDEYENTIFNVLKSTFEPTVLSSNPRELPQGTTLSISLTGRNTNWRDGATSVLVEGTGVAVVSTSVLSATTLTTVLSVASDAAFGFRDIEVTTDLGAEVETATGVSVVEVTPPLVLPTILSVDPANLRQGLSTEVMVRGGLTAWDDTTTLSLGAGITVDSLDVVSPTSLTAQITVSPTAAIGFRTASVTTGASTQSLSRAVFVNVEGDVIPELVSVDPDTGTQGQSLSVRITGQNTNFVDGVTMASFGAGIDVTGVSVIDSTTADVSIQIAIDAALGFRNVNLATGDEVAVVLNGFFVGATVGNVEVEVNGHKLKINGNEDSEKVLVSQDPDGNIIVTGLGGTQINGETVPFVAGKGIRDIEAEMGPGDDMLSLVGLTVEHDLKVDMQSGGDMLVLQGVTVKHEAKLDLGKDDEAGNLAEIIDSVFGHDLELLSDSGEDTVVLERVNVDHDLKVNLGMGLDILRLLAVDVAHKSELELGEDKEASNFVEITDSLFGHDLELKTGDADDEASLTHVRVGHDLKVDMKKGGDTLLLDDVLVDHMEKLDLGKEDGDEIIRL